jgi:hypothetical protein
MVFSGDDIAARYKPDEGESNATRAKRQRTGAFQDASRFTTATMSRAASWTAAALRRFSLRDESRVGFKTPNEAYY